MRYKVYLEPSIPSCYYDSSEPWIQYQTQLFWGRLHQYEVFVSKEGKREISKTRDANRRQQLLALMAPFQELDSDILEIQTLAQEYVSHGIFSVRYLPDAVHVATVTVYHLNFLVSWNFQHLADAKRMLWVNSINLSLGYGLVAVVPPPML